jgi:hypothetical protein
MRQMMSQFLVRSGYFAMKLGRRVWVKYSDLSALPVSFWIASLPAYMICRGATFRAPLSDALA